MLEADDEIIEAIPTVQARPLRTLPHSLSFSLSLSPTDTRDGEGEKEKFKHNNKWRGRESDMVMIMLEKGVDTRAKRCHHKCAILNRYHAHTTLTCFIERGRAR
jgi:hypothetical protein